MNATQITTVVVSAVTLCVSAVMIWRALRGYRRLLEGGARPVPLRRFTNRRLTMGLVLAVVAVMLFLGVCVLDNRFQKSPAAFTWFWLAVLGLLAWLLALAVFDIVSTLHSRLEQWQRQHPPPRPPGEHGEPREKGDE